MLHECWPFHEFELFLHRLCLKIAKVSEDLAKPSSEPVLYRGFLVCHSIAFIS